jgi:hypothetical protein
MENSRYRFLWFIAIMLFLIFFCNGCGQEQLGKASNPDRLEELESISNEVNDITEKSEVFMLYGCEVILYKAFGTSRYNYGGLVKVDCDCEFDIYSNNVK